MAEFHFLRAAWLIALPIGLWFIWRVFARRARAGGWNAVVDAPLRAYVLASPKAMRESRWPLVAALLAWTFGVVALAGPTWERLPVPVVRSSEALVVALDLSRSMDAGDILPSRLARAKLKLLDLLERRDAGQTGLVVFSTHGYTVTPLTTDTRTIAALTSALASDLMPAQGSSIRAGLNRAAQLLEQSDATAGEILVVSDADIEPADVELARELATAGHRVHVLAVGTREGAPIPLDTGGFLSDPTGRVVLPRLDERGLRDLAAAGAGRFAALTADDSDLDALFPGRGPLASRAVLEATAQDDDRQAEVWLDRGPWLVLLLLPLLALGFRRGWIVAWAVVLLVPLPQAQALEWADLWQRADQRGLEAFEAEQPESAAELFENDEWRAAAQFRAGQFEQSAATLAGLDTIEAQYNRGNALAKAGALEPAIAAYDRALELDPEHADARYNREVLEQLLQDREQNQSQQQQSGEQQETDGQNDFAGESEGAGVSEQPSDSQSSNESGGREGDQSPGASGSSNAESGEAGDSGPRSGEELGASGEQETEDGDPGQDGSESADADDPRNDAPQSAAVNDLEEWASEQAAEQWLRRIPQDPGGLLRRKFLYQYQRSAVIDDNGVSMWPAPSENPW